MTEREELGDEVNVGPFSVFPAEFDMLPGQVQSYLLSQPLIVSVRKSTLR
jgi:hypothetical protein